MIDPESEETQWVMVVWHDITGNDQPWMDRDEAEELKPAIIMSVGTVVNETEVFITIAGSMGIEGELGNVNCIPKAVVVRQVELWPRQI